MWYIMEKELGLLNLIEETQKQFIFYIAFIIKNKMADMEPDNENLDIDVADEDTFEENVEDPELNDDGDEEEGSEQEEETILHKLREKESKYDVVSVYKTYESYFSQKKVTKPFITKFEKAKLLGVRAEMIASGAPVLVVVPSGVNSAYEIAMLEYREKKIPLMVRRYLPNGAFEDWRMDDLVI